MALKFPISKYCLPVFILLYLPLYQAGAQNNKLIIIDPLAAGFFSDQPGDNGPGQKVILLPGEGNPVGIIAAELSKSAYNEIHIYALTKPGSLIFDEINIIPENIEEQATAFRSWKAGLREGCRIIFHSGDLLSEPGGEIITGKIKEYTGCQVSVVE